MTFLANVIQKIKFKLINLIGGKRMDKTFIHYYNTNYWGGKESVSGRGSDSLQTNTVILGIEKLISDFGFTSILDVPCGDFNWMKKVDFSFCKYIGGDIVPGLITKNRDSYSNNTNISFEIIDITTTLLPQVDLIICRDCLVHFSYKDIKRSILNFQKSNSKYLLVTSFPGHNKNVDIITGNWRALNLEEKPFNFPKPEITINENCTEENGLYSDKSLCLYKLSSIFIN